MALRILEIDVKRYTVDKVYIFTFFVIHRSKPQKTQKIRPKMHPKIPPNLTKSMIENRCCFGVDLGMILEPKMHPKCPPNRPKCHPWAQRKPLGGAMGPQRCLKTDFNFNLAPQMIVKSPKTGPKCPQNGPNYTNVTHKKDPQHAPRPISAQDAFT